MLQKASVKKDDKALVLLKLRYFYHRKCFLVAKKVPEVTTSHGEKGNCIEAQVKSARFTIRPAGLIPGKSSCDFEV